MAKNIVARINLELTDNNALACEMEGDLNDILSILSSALAQIARDVVKTDKAPEFFARFGTDALERYIGEEEANYGDN